MQHLDPGTWTGSQSQPQQKKQQKSFNPSHTLLTRICICRQCMHWRKDSRRNTVKRACIQDPDMSKASAFNWISNGRNTCIKTIFFNCHYLAQRVAGPWRLNRIQRGQEARIRRRRRNGLKHFAIFLPILRFLYSISHNHAIITPHLIFVQQYEPKTFFILVLALPAHQRYWYMIDYCCSSPLGGPDASQFLV